MRKGHGFMISAIIIAIIAIAILLVPQIHMNNLAWFDLCFMIWLCIFLFGALFIGAFLTNIAFIDEPYDEKLVALFLLIPYSGFSIAILWLLAIHFGVV